MIPVWDYKLDGHRRTWEKARKRKAELKAEGYRVKIRKGMNGGYDIYFKDVLLIDIQQNHGNGRDHA